MRKLTLHCVLLLNMKCYKFINLKYTVEITLIMTNAGYSI